METRTFPNASHHPTEEVLADTTLEARLEQAYKAHVDEAPATPKSVVESLSRQVWDTAQATACSDGSVAIEEAVEAKNSAQKHTTEHNGDNYDLRKVRDKLKNARNKAHVDLGKSQGLVSVQHDLLSNANAQIEKQQTELADAQRRAATAERIAANLRETMSDPSDRK